MIGLPGIRLALSASPSGSGGRPRVDGAAATVLVVEDDPSTRRVLVLLFELRGYGVVEADNGRTGLEIAIDIDVDLLVSDLQLPGMSGIEMARAVSKQGGSPPMIAVTSGPADLIARAEQSSCFAEVLTKPVDVNELLEIARRLTA